MSSATSPSSTQPVAWKRFVWPAIVVALLAGHLIVISAALLLSTALIPAASTAPAGYAEALRWDDEQALRRASERLGWTLVVEPATTVTPTGERLVTFTLEGPSGEPIDGAELRVAMYHHSRPGEVFEALVPAVDGAPGVYQTPMRLRREGQWRLSAKARRGDDHLLVDADFWLRKPEVAR